MANKIVRWGVGIAVLVGVTGCLPMPVLATPSLSPDSYSWSQVFVEPESVPALARYGGSTPYPVFGSPIKGYPPIRLPYGQPNSYQNPHRGIDINCSRGTAVVTIAAGFIESVTGNTVIQACDLDANGTVDVRVSYMHLGRVLVRPDPDKIRPKGRKIGTSGMDPADGVNKLHFTIQGYYDFVGANLNVRPDKFFRNAANWNNGSDTAFMKKIYKDVDSHMISFTAYCLDELGARVAPSEVAFFHRRAFETAWRVTYLTPDVYGNCSFDYLAYRQNGEQIYLPGFRVHNIIRAKALARPLPAGGEVTPAAISDYGWEFSPCLNERPYEDPADWPGSGQQWSYWYLDIPAPREYQWFSQSDPSIANHPEYCWDDTHLVQLYYPANSDPDKRITPWLTLEQKDGCCACSWAMVLRNLGEATVSQHTDFRSGTTDYLIPDPFIISLASTKDYDITCIEPDVRYECYWVCHWFETYASPLFMHHANVASEFGVSHKRRMFAVTTLTSNIGSEAGPISFSVGDASGFPNVDVTPIPSTPPTPPTPRLYITIDSEIMAVGKIDKASNTFSDVRRAQEGTQLASHAQSSQSSSTRVYEETEEGKAWIMTQQLAARPQGQGLIVGLQGNGALGEAGHYVVFCASPFVNSDFPYAPTDSPDDPDRWKPLAGAQAVPEPTEPSEPGVTVLPTPTKWEKGFRICDPGTATIAKGASVLYKDSYSFVDKNPPKRFIEVVSIMVVGP